MTLQARGLNVKIGDRSILEQVSARFQRGKITAIVGPNGAGKSTFMDCLSYLRKPDEGLVSLKGGEIGKLSDRTRARILGYLPQYADIVWDVDCETFVGLGRIPHKGPWGLTARDREAIATALTKTDTCMFSERMITTLSGGERARVLIARALAGEPDWILADEPLAGLDPGHAIDVAQLFRSLAHKDGLGIVLTLHDLDMAMRVADRVIILARGQIIADDEAAIALTPENLRKAYGIEAEFITTDTGPVLNIKGRV